MGAFGLEKLIEVTVPDLTPVADHLVEHFRAQGYDVIAKNDSGIWDVSITKGGMFKAVAGLKTALKIEIKPLVNGTLVKAGIGLFKRRAVPTLVVGLVYWPALVGQVWGLVRQASLDKEAVNVIDAELRRHARVHDVPGEPAARSAGDACAPGRPNRTTEFCTCCGQPLDRAMRFCPQCGHERLSGTDSQSSS